MLSESLMGSFPLNQQVEGWERELCEGSVGHMLAAHTPARERRCLRS